MIRTVLVSESMLLRPEFLFASRQITGQDHGKIVDRTNLRSSAAEDIAIINDFARQPLGPAITTFGFLVAGRADHVDDIVEAASGMSHVTADIDNPIAKAVIISGSVSDWGFYTAFNCRNNQPKHVREAFTQVYYTLSQKGLQFFFEGLRKQDSQDGTILLLPRA